MENFFARYKNPLVLMAVLFIQVVALATQVKRQENGRAAGGGTRLIRVWTVTAFSPVEKMFVSTGHFFRDGWHNYVDLRNVRKQNQELQEQVSRMQMEQARLKQDAEQAHRLQVLLDFKERYVAKTMAAQVIGTSGTEQSKMITIDKGAAAGVKPDQAVITPDGIVGKVKEVYRLSSQVLLINDHDGGAGVILEGTRLQGIVRGSSLGELQINDVMADEKVEAGDHIITSGGDRIFPKGLSVGTVISASPDRDNDPFLNIKVKPAADLNRLEEVLVVTEIAESAPSPSGSTPMRAADILSQRLPSIPKQDPNAPKTPGATASPAVTPPAAANQTKKPVTTAPVTTTPDQKPDQKKEVAGTNTAVKAPSVTAGAPAKSPTPGAKPVVGTTAAGAAGAAMTGKPANASAPNGTGAVTASKPANAPASNGANGTTSIKPANVPVPNGTGAATATKSTNAAAPNGVNASTVPKPATKPAGNSQPSTTGANAGGAATPTPTPKPKMAPKKSNPSVTAPGASPNAPDDKKSQPQGNPPAPTATPTPEGSLR